MLAEKTNPVLIGIPAGEAEEWWPLCEPLIEKALTRTQAIDDFLPSDLLKAVQTRDMQLWVVHDGGSVLCAAMTEVLVFPRRKVLGLPFLGAKPGSFRHWLFYFDTIKAFAREQGCTAVRGWGRKGWEKWLDPYAVRVEFDCEV